MGLASAAVLGALVAVSVEPDVQPAAQLALTESCSSVFPDDYCVVANGEIDAPYQATVAWAGDDDQLHAEVRLTEVQGGQVFERPLSFGPGAREQERWEAIGLVLAALVNVALVERQQKNRVEPKQGTETEKASQPHPEEADAAPPPPPAPEVQPVIEPDVGPPRGRLEVGASALGSGDTQLVAWGATVRASWSAAPPPWAVTAAASVLGDGAPVDQMVVAPRVGIEYTVPLPPLRLRLRAEAAAAIARFSARSAGQKDVRTDTRFGPAFGTALVWPFAPTLEAFVAGSALLLWPPLDIRVRSSSVARAGVLGWHASAGAAFLF